MSDIYYTSDTHYSHANIIKYCHRPFLSKTDEEELSARGSWHDGNWKGEGASDWRMTDEAIAMMDDELIRQVNATVPANAVLWHLGDFAMPSRNHNYRQKCREMRDRINCKTVNIVWGNHDDRRIRDLFNEAHELVMITDDRIKAKVVLCHYAMAVWHGSHRGNIHLYGHSHSEAEPWLDRTMPSRRSLDVGVDNANKILGSYRPFTGAEILKAMKDRVGFAFDHHVGKMSNTPSEESLN